MTRRLQSIDLRDIHIDDGFWTRYTTMVQETLIPYQWAVLNDRVEDTEPSHCIENLRIAAGESNGAFEGEVFQDSDVAKWLEAVAYSLETRPNPELEKLADETISLIGRAQQPDGYLNTYFTIKEPQSRWTNLREGHELYVAGHFIEAAVAYHHATGKRQLLEIVCRFADLICSLFGVGEGRREGYPGHSEIELALVKLYRVTEEKKYLDTAAYFINRRGTAPDLFAEEAKKPGCRQIFPSLAPYDPKYAQNHLPVRMQQTAEGHAVRATYLYSAMADVACETKDETLLAGCRRLWENITEKRMYINGGIGSSGHMERFTTDYDLPNDSCYCETCASIGLAQFGLRMAQITGEARYFDTVERALYNVVAASVALDGKSFFYVNPLEVRPDACIPNTSCEHVKPVRQKWFKVACCPPNVARTLASLGQFIYSTQRDNLYVNLFIANKSVARLDSGMVEISLDGRFPWGNNIGMSVSADAGFNLAVRIPAYARDFELLADGIPAQFTVRDGYAWLPVSKGKCRIDIAFSAPPQLVFSHEYVRSCAGQAAVTRGPLVYCMEEIDNKSPLSSLLVCRDTNFAEQWEPILGGMVTLQVSGWHEKVLESNGLYYSKATTLREMVQLRLVPYCLWCNRKPGEMRVWIRIVS